MSTQHKKDLWSDLSLIQSHTHTHTPHLIFTHTHYHSLSYGFTSHFSFIRNSFSTPSLSLSLSLSLLHNQSFRCLLFFLSLRFVSPFFMLVTKSSVATLSKSANLQQFIRTYHTKFTILWKLIKILFHS